MQFTPLKGFVNTPVSKSICIITTFLAIALSVLQFKFYLNFQIDPFIIEYHQYWRLLTYQLSVVNESDFLLCTLLWFLFKNLERFFGSSRYLSHITVFALYNALICFIVMCFGQIAENMILYLLNEKLGLGEYTYVTGIFNQAIPGPLGIISSLYVCYGRYVPVSYKFNILLSKPHNDQQMVDIHPQTSATHDLQSEISVAHSNLYTVEQPLGRVLTLTNHIQIQVLYTILFLNQGFKSMVPCSVGLFLGTLYVNDLLPGASWSIPNIIFKLFINPLLFLRSVALNFSLTRWGSGYSRVGLVEIDRVVINEPLDDEQDETRDNESREIRAETPVRPLGSQLLDTFRA